MESSARPLGTGAPTSVAPVTEVSVEPIGNAASNGKRKKSKNSRKKKKADIVLRSVVRLASSASLASSQVPNIDKHDWFAPRDYFELPSESSTSSSLSAIPGEGSENEDDDAMTLATPSIEAMIPSEYPHTTAMPSTSYETTDTEIDSAPLPFANCDIKDAVEFWQPVDGNLELLDCDNPYTTLAAQFDSAVRVAVYYHAQLQNQIEATKTHMNKLSQQNALLKNTNQQCEQIVELQRVHDELQETHSRLAKEHQRVGEELAQARNANLAQTNSFRSGMEYWRSEAGKLKDALFTARAQARSAAELQASSQKQLADVESQLRSELQSAQEHHETLQASLDTETASCVQLKDVIARIEGERNDLMASLVLERQQSQKQHQEYQDLLHIGAQALEQLAASHAEVDMQRLQLSKNLDASRQAESSAKSMRQDLVRERDAAFASLATLRESHNREIQVLNDDIESITQRQRDALTHNRSLLSEVDALKADRQTLSNDISTLKASQQAAFAEFDKRAAEVTASLELALKEQADRNSLLLSKARAAKEVQVSSSARIQALSTEIESLKAEKALHTEKDQKQTDHTRVLAELHSQQQASQTMIAGLEQNVNDVNRDKKSLEAEVARLERLLLAEQESLGRGRYEAHKEIQQLTASMEEQKQLVATLKEQKACLEEDVSSLTEAKTSLRSKVERSQAELRDALQREMENARTLESASKEHEKELKDVRRQLESASAMVRSVEKSQQEEKARHGEVVKKLQEKVADAVKAGMSFQALHAQAVADGKNISSLLEKINRENTVFMERLRTMEEDNVRLREVEKGVRGLEETKSRLEQESIGHLKTIKLLEVGLESLQKVDTDRTRDVATIRSEFDQLKKYREEAIDRCTTKEAELAEVSQTLGDATRTLEALKHRLDESGKEQKVLREDSANRILDLQHARDTLFSQLKLAHTQAHRSNNVNAQLSSEIASLQTQLSDAMEQKKDILLRSNTLSRENDELEEERSELTKANEELRSILSTSSRHLPRHDTQPHAAHTSSSLSTHDLRVMFEQERQLYTDEISRLSSDITKLNQNNAELHISKASLESRLEERNETCLKITARLNTAHDDRGILVKAHGTIKSKLDGDILRLTRQNEALTQSLTDVSRERDRIGGILDDEHATYIEMEEMLSQQVESLTQEKLRLCDRVEVLDAELKSVMSETSSTQAVEQQLRDTIREAEGKLAQRVSLCLELQGAKDRAESKAREHHGDLEKTRLEMEQVRSQILSVQSSLYEMTLEKEVLLKQISDERTERMDLENLRVASDELMEVERSKLASQVSELASHNNDLENQLSASTTDFHSLAETSTHKGKEIDALKAMYTTLVNEVNSLRPKNPPTETNIASSPREQKVAARSPSVSPPAPPPPTPSEPSAPVDSLVRTIRKSGRLSAIQTPSPQPESSSSRLPTVPSSPEASASSKVRQKTPAPSPALKTRSSPRNKPTAASSKTAIAKALKRKAAEMEDDNDGERELVPRRPASKRNVSGSSGHQPIARAATPKKKTKVRR